MTGGHAESLRGVPVLVTGATGKLGRHLVTALLGEGARVAILTRDCRRAGALWPGAPIDCRRADLTDAASLNAVLDGIDTVFHLASYSPAPGEPDIYEAPSHWPITAIGTRNLTRVVAVSQVRHLVYASSVKAMGDAAGARGRPADEDDEPQPETLYGRAKLDAERSILALGLAQPIQVSVLRLPMVYGLKGQGNVARLIDAIARRRFPPWPRVDNRRSAVHVADAVRALLVLARDPRVNGQVYLVTDGRQYSTRWLYERICLALGRPIPAWAVPLWALRFAAELGSRIERVSGRSMPLNLNGLSKLTGDAWYSSEKLRRELEFIPEHDLEQDIPRMVSESLAARRVG
ncbi:NAD-dependent epimerase/dehydratase family protein [Thiocystis violascens]|uniref:Nucleoside-diphosphate-sugar epimerase n=1 Tax=Thiocystis violascens (strain ATCC 17096 / DSM 198 / 6111) TaxID=765911 RepID=I3YC87_THIV6|nr:NAD-dependent epimerase/dehydratase family protein [Thiocystis violascens]AFL74605.1 nucleoside-diphosphate-sugar epimerase [Thiocystis violascens DSM 198]